MLHLNAQNTRGRTALHEAAARGHREIMGLLVDAGADVAIRDREGKTAADLLETWARRPGRPTPPRTP